MAAVTDTREHPRMVTAPSFLSEAPSDPVEFEVGGWKRKGDGDERVEVRQTFLARRDVSYGLLLQNIEAADSGNGSLLAIFDLVLADPDDPDQDEKPADEQDGLSVEARRFRDFVGSPDVYVSQKALLAAARWIAGEQAGRPTGPPSDSRSTRRAAGRGSAGRRR